MKRINRGRKYAYSAGCGSLTLTTRSAFAQTSRGGFDDVRAGLHVLAVGQGASFARRASRTSTSWPASRSAVTPLGTSPTRVS